MINLKEFIYNIIWPSEKIFEMATISKQERWGNDLYRIATHGTAAGDRENPHIHIYLTRDVKPYNKFNFEISLTDILCHDEINLIFQRDVKTGIKHTNRAKCSWKGYSSIRDGFEQWLFRKSTTPGDFIDNLDAIIYWYDEESDKDCALLTYMKERGMKVLDKYKKYFSRELQDKFKECF